MKKVRDRTIRNESIVLDETEFHNCKFIDCQLNYSGGQFMLSSCHLSNCHYTFMGAAERTIRFLQYSKILSGNPSEWRVIPDTPDLPA